MPDQALDISQFLGIDNTSDMMSVSVQRKGGIYFYEIDNVDIDDNFKPHRRVGYGETPIVSCTSGRSLWASPSGKICLFVDGTNFKKLNTDDTSTTLITGVDPSDTFAYVEVGNFVYFSNMSIVGYIDTRIGTTSVFPTPTQNFKAKMIGGQILEYHYNRLYAVNQENVFHSDATILTQMDSRKNVIALPSRGTMFRSVVDGVYVSDKEKVYFWAGRGPDDFVSREVLDVPAIEGMSASATVKKRKASTKTVLFMTDKGLYEGYPEGIITPKQGGLFSMDNLDRGTVIIKSSKYQQYIGIGKYKSGTGGSSGEFIFIPAVMTGEMEEAVPLPPNEAVGCVLWLRSDMGVTKDGNGIISTWADQGGDGNDFVPAPSNTGPTWSANQLNGHPSISFNGTTDFLYKLGLDLEQPVDIYIVMQQKTHSHGNSVYGFYWYFDDEGNGPDQSGIRMAQIGDSPNLSINSSKPYNVIPIWECETTSQLPLNTWGLVQGLFNGISSITRVNGGLPNTGSIGTTSTGTSSRGWGIGGAYRDWGIFGTKEGVSLLEMDMVEIIIYNYALSDSGRQSVETYLKERYGIS